MQKIKYSPEDEQLLMSKLWSPQIRDDPEAFVLFNYPWGMPNTPLAKHSGPRRWQRKVLREITEHIKKNNGQVDYEALRCSVSSGRGIGKSALVAWLIQWMLSCHIGSSVIVSANSENQLRSVTWGELNKWATMALNSHWWELSATKMQPAQWLIGLVERDLKKGTRYWGAEGRLWSEENPDSYAGVHNHDGTMVIFDEASGIADSIWSVAAGFFTEPVIDRYWFAFSNPRRNTGYFFECFNNKRAFWRNHQIDARTVEGTDKAVYDQIIQEYGEDYYEARVEVYGEFPSTGDDQFISPSFVDAAMAREQYKDMTAPLVVGIDPARHGRDSTVIVVRRGRDIINIRRFAGDDTMTVVGHVIDVIEEYRPDLTVMDEGGLGYGILDRLNEQKYKVRGVNFAWTAKSPIMWGNKRAEMWGAMKDWLKTASLPADKQLKTDLTGPKRKPNSAGTVFLETKKEMKARGLSSPDAADAIAVTFAFPVQNKELLERKAKKMRYITHSGGTTGWMGA